MSKIIQDAANLKNPLLPDGLQGDLQGQLTQLKSWRDSMIAAKAPMIAEHMNSAKDAVVNQGGE